MLRKPVPSWFGYSSSPLGPIMFRPAAAETSSTATWRPPLFDSDIKQALIFSWQAVSHELVYQLMPTPIEPGKEYVVVTPVESVTDLVNGMPAGRGDLARYCPKFG